MKIRKQPFVHAAVNQRKRPDLILKPMRGDKNAQRLGTDKFGLIAAFLWDTH